MKTIMYNKSKSARNLSGTTQKASNWGNPKAAPPRLTVFFTDHRHFGFGRLITPLTMQPWPNRPIGPPNVKTISAEEADAYINDVGTGLKNKGGWRKLNATRQLKTPELLTDLSRYKLGRA
jgi:hypothetical protein